MRSGTKPAVAAFLLTLAGTAAAHAADRFGESCRGTETVQIGTQAPRPVPYALDFSADLGSGRYCYEKCGPDRTYAIADARARPIKLADLERADQVRHLEFDPRTSMLTDEQTFDAGLGKVIRSALAHCVSTPFREPPPLAKSGTR